MLWSSSLLGFFKNSVGRIFFLSQKYYLLGTDIVFYCPLMFEYCFLLRKRNAWRFVRVQLSIYLFPQLRDLIYLGEVNHWLRSTKLGNESPERMKNSICAGDIWLVSFSVFSRISSCPGWSTERACDWGNLKIEMKAKCISKLQLMSTTT